MNASELIGRVRKSGHMWLDELGRLNAEGASEAQMAELADSHDLVVGLLREEIASARWGNSGKNPDWWRVPEQAWTYSEQTLKPISELVRIWATEKCVVSMRCSTKARALHRDFLESIGLGSEFATAQDFLAEMAALGWPSIDGWIDNICFAEDFLAALQRLDRGRNCPEEGELKVAAFDPQTARPNESEWASAREARVKGTAV